jgi:hypothetical protein
MGETGDSEVSGGRDRRAGIAGVVDDGGELRPCDDSWVQRNLSGDPLAGILEMQGGVEATGTLRGQQYDWILVDQDE